MRQVALISGNLGAWKSELARPLHKDFAINVYHDQPSGYKDTSARCSSGPA